MNRKLVRAHDVVRDALQYNKKSYIRNRQQIRKQFQDRI